MSQPELRGVCPIVDTPFTSAGEVDYAGLKSLAETLVDDGCHALALFGFASEFYKLTEAEREKMTEIVVEACNEGGVPSVVSVTAQATDVAVQEAKQIEEKGADALMLLPPYIRNPPTDAIAEHAERVAL
jgi:4-hydroxy-tetrahydrodipicolinate synthase